jgi:site-specific recombinase XerD
MLRLALDGNVKPNRQHKTFPFKTEAPGFLVYLREEPGLRDNTVNHYAHRLHCFAIYLKRVGVTSLTELSAALLPSFVVDTAPQLSRTCRRDLCGELRVFLRYCYREQLVLLR